MLQKYWSDTRAQTGQELEPPALRGAKRDRRVSAKPSTRYYNTEAYLRRFDDYVAEHPDMIDTFHNAMKAQMQLFEQVLGKWNPQARALQPVRSA